LLIIVTETAKLIALIIIIIIIMHGKKYDLLHGKVLGVSKNLIKCASLLRFGILQYKLHQQSAHSHANLIVIPATVR
jgi:hypothetical protein